MAELEVVQVKHLPKIAGGFIFNAPAFQKLKPGKHLNFVLTRQSRPIARIWFTHDDKLAISGLGATFGSLDYAEKLTEDVISNFLREVIKLVKAHDVNQIIIKHWPDSYSNDNWYGRFLKMGFTVKERGINQHLPVSNEAYLTHLKYNEQKKLNQSRIKGFTFRILGEAELQIVYDLVRDTRNRKGYLVSMSYDDLYQAVKSMPEKYLLFGLFDKNKLIAASVSIRIAKDILYNFYHADDFTYRSLSPLVMLVGKIYNFCQDEGIRILDLGVSSDQGELNQGLFQFKKNLGCLTSDKITYIYGYDR